MESHTVFVGWVELDSAEFGGQLSACKASCVEEGGCMRANDEEAQDRNEGKHDVFGERVIDRRELGQI